MKILKESLQVRFLYCKMYFIIQWHFFLLEYNIRALLAHHITPGLEMESPFSGYSYVLLLCISDLSLKHTHTLVRHWILIFHRQHSPHCIHFPDETPMCYVYSHRKTPERKNDYSTLKYNVVHIIYLCYIVLYIMQTISVHNLHIGNKKEVTKLARIIVLLAVNLHFNFN